MTSRTPNLRGCSTCSCGFGLLAVKPEHPDAQRVSADYFQVLGVSPAVGRTLDAEEDPPDGTKQIVVSEGFRRLRLGGQVFQRPICPERLKLQAVQGDLLLGILQDDFDIQNAAVFRYRR